MPPGSFWTKTVTQHGVSVDPSSSAMISYWLGSLQAGDNGMIALTKWGYADRMTTGSDPTYSLQSSCQWSCNLDRLGPVPIPTGTQASPDADAHLSILAPSGKEWDMWKAVWNGSTWTAGCGEAINLATEITVPAGVCGSTNGNIPNVLVGLNPRELAAGHIDHPLAFAGPGASNSTRCPANGTTNTNPGVPWGGLLQLDPSFNVDGSTLAGWEKTIAHALQDYGAYFVDNSPNLQFSTEITVNQGSNQWATLMGWTGDYQYFSSAFRQMLGSMRVMTAPC